MQSIDLLVRKDFTITDLMVVIKLRRHLTSLNHSSAHGEGFSSLQSSLGGSSSSFISSFFISAFSSTKDSLMPLITMVKVSGALLSSRKTGPSVVIDSISADGGQL